MIIDRYEAIRKIRLRDICLYLKNNGWEENNNFPNKKLYVFNKLIDGDLFTICIPSDECYKDYIMRVDDALDILSVLEDRKIVEIITEIIKLREITIEVYKGNINSRRMAAVHAKRKKPLLPINEVNEHITRRPAMSAKKQKDKPNSKKQSVIKF